MPFGCPAAIELQPTRSNSDLVLDAALQAAAGLRQLLRFRRDSATAASAADQGAATARPLSAAGELTNGAEAVSGQLESPG